MPDREPCPDCGGHPTEPESHADGCPRINTCGQIGPPWPAPPFHRWVVQPAEPGPDEYRLTYTYTTPATHRALMHPQEPTDA